MTKAQINRFKGIEKIPYKILVYLALHNENVFKLLKYPDEHALDKPNLTFKEKMQLLALNEGIDANKNLFLKPLVSDEMIDSDAQLRVYQYCLQPYNSMLAVVSIRFDTIVGSKTSIIYDEDGIPVSRVTRIESEILDTLNGKDLVGIGDFSFNKDFSTIDKEMLTLSNSKNFYGSYFIMSVRWMINTNDSCVND